MRKGKWYIYQLESPTGEVRYVGATTDPQRRYQEHLKGIKQGKALKLWVQGLLKQGKKPTMYILEETNWSNWQSREKHWINTLKTGRLLNRQPGGIVKRSRCGKYKRKD